jgi:hypothetical protein
MAPRGPKKHRSPRECAPNYGSAPISGRKSRCVEAIPWALNLAPVPRDHGGKPNPACKAVLIGLANHASPDGKDTFPSEHTLVRYTCLSKRTVQTALDRRCWNASSQA